MTTDQNQIAFISGANRGIGKELALQLSERACNVIAGYRDEIRSQALLNDAQNRDNLFPFQIDVTSENDLEKLHRFISDQFGALDMLINNAGIFLNRSTGFKELEWADVRRHFDVNVGSAFLTTKWLYPLLKAGEGKKVINISSQLGSIERNTGGSFPYNVSKTAMNMLSKHQAVEYKGDGVTAVSVSPGWVRTDMGGDAAPLSVQESASKILRIIDTIPLSRSGQFVDVNGDKLPY